jgi:hypothetical protein
MFNKLLKPLMPELKFTDAELHANRQGYMLQPQRQRLEDILKERVRRVPYVTAIFALVMLIGLYLFLSGDRYPTVFGGTLLVGLGVGNVAIFLDFRHLREDIRNNDVLMSEGAIQMQSFDMLLLSIDWFQVNALTFELTAELKKTLKDAGNYRVYYSPKAKLLLSYEEVPTKKPMDESK